MSEVDDSEDIYVPEFFSASGRIGRWRFIGFTSIASFSAYILMSLVMGMLMVILRSLGTSGINIMMVSGLVVICIVLAVQIIFLKRRLNDLDQSGWMIFLMLIPIVGQIFYLYLLFAPGSSGSNRYGPAPSKNSAWYIIVGLIVPVMIVGILAAVALPAYKQYTDRARAAQQQNLPAQPAEPELPTPAQ